MTQVSAIHQTGARRSAFTLVEMLIASILVATLMATVWSLTSLYSGFLTAGRAQAEEQQLARSLIDIISADLHAVIPDRAGDSRLDTTLAVLPRQADGFVEPLSGDFEFTEQETTSLAGLTLFGLGAGGQPLPTFDIRGSAHELTLTVADAEPQIALIEIDEVTGEPIADESLSGVTSGLTSEATHLPGPPHAPEYRRIVYRFEPPRIVEADDELARPPGLARYDIPIEHLSLLTLTDDLGDTNGSAETIDVSDVISKLTEQGLTSIKVEHVPEVVGCEFEYLTDHGWESSWSSFNESRHLKAIRVRLRLLSPEEHAELVLALGANESFETTDPEDVNAVIDAELTDDFNDEESPFAAFAPRTFERIILMSTPPALAIGEEGQSSGRQGVDTFAGATLGGEP